MVFNFRFICKSKHWLQNSHLFDFAVNYCDKSAPLSGIVSHAINVISVLSGHG